MAKLFGMHTIALKPGVKGEDSEKHIFVICASLAIFLLICAGILLLALRRQGYLDEELDIISVFNLLVDVVVGIFTVWGLYWAATEFAQSARRPDLQLLPTKILKLTAYGIEWNSAMRSPPFHLPGRYIWPGIPLQRDPNIVFGLYLENTGSKAGRYIRIATRVLATPVPIHCSFRGGIDIEWTGEQEESAFSAQFEESLVAYERAPVFLGAVTVHWDPELPSGTLPENVVIDYDCFSLDGVSHGKMEFHVEWDEGDI